MKRFLPSFLAVVFGFATCYASSDSSKTVQDLKPVKGMVATELNVNPFNGELSLNNSLNQIKVRLFTSDVIALRFGFNLKNEKLLSDQNQPYGANPVRFKDEKSSTTLGLNFGIEKHFKGSRRVSPYIGADITIETRSAKQERINGQTTTTLKNAWYIPTEVPIYNYNNNGNYYSYQYVDIIGNNAYFSYGLNVFTGFDFYITKNFFFGYEFNLGFSKTSNKKPEITVVPTNNNINPDFDYENTSFTFGPRLLNGIRLGYNF